MESPKYETANVAPVDVVTLDAGHMAMISHPKAFAEILNTLHAAP